jgi:hypothetical protein
MAAEDALRLAWLAQREGRTTRRDALVTLAVAAGASESAPWVEQGRAWLVAQRPDHLFATFPTLTLALADRRVRGALRRLQYSFPAGRVRSLLQRGAVARGPYSGRLESLTVILDELFRPAVPARRPSRVAQALADPVPPLDEATRVRLTKSYVNTLLALAVLFETVLNPPADRKTRAA